MATFYKLKGSHPFHPRPWIHGWLQFFKYHSHCRTFHDIKLPYMILWKSSLLNASFWCNIFIQRNNGHWGLHASDGLNGITTKLSHSNPDRADNLPVWSAPEDVWIYWYRQNRLRRNKEAVHPMKRIRILLWFDVLGYWSIISIYFMVASLELGQSCDCPSAGEATLKNMGKWITWNRYKLIKSPQQYQTQNCMNFTC